MQPRIRRPRLCVPSQLMRYRVGVGDGTPVRAADVGFDFGHRAHRAAEDRVTGLPSSASYDVARGRAAACSRFTRAVSPGSISCEQPAGVRNEVVGRKAFVLTAQLSFRSGIDITDNSCNPRPAFV
jgi:hypothetical protein